MSEWTRDQMVALRREGKSLRAVGQIVGLSYERVRQITEGEDVHNPNLISETKLERRLGFPAGRLARLRAEGQITAASVLTKGHVTYDLQTLDLAKVKDLLEKRCRDCGQVIKGNGKCCPSCQDYRRCHNYRFRSAESQRAHIVKTNEWRKQNPERWAEIQARAQRTYAAKKRQEHLKDTRYVIRTGSYLPVGTVIRAVDYRKDAEHGLMAVLDSGLTVPVNCLKKVT